MAMGITETWGVRIRAARDAKSLTQSQLAEQLGVEQTTVSRWEAGITAPGPDRQVAIANLLERDWADMFNPVEDVA